MPANDTGGAGSTVLRSFDVLGAIFSLPERAAVAAPSSLRVLVPANAEIWGAHAHQCMCAFFQRICDCAGLTDLSLALRRTLSVSW